MHNYAGNVGSTFPTDDAAGTTGKDGVFLYADPNNGGLKFRDITDGTSNTLMVAEKAGNDTAATAGHPCAFCSCNVIFIGEMDNNPGNNEASEALGSLAIASPNTNNERGFHSYHTGGAHALLCDGAVRFLSENMSSAVRTAISTRQGDESLGLD
jgi:prepilin-type processing-associated H-X9-DG protein